MRDRILICVLSLLCACGAHAQTVGSPAPAPSAAQPATAETDLAEAARLNQSVVKLFSEHKYDEALPLAERVLALREKWLKPDDLNLADALSNLAALYQSKGNFDKAEPLYLRALPIYEQDRTASEQRLADVLYALGVLRYRKGNYGQAAAYLERVVTLKEKAQDGASLDIINVLLDLSEVYLVKGDYQRATPLLHRAVELWSNKLAPDDPKREQYSDRVICMVSMSGHKEELRNIFPPPEPPGGATISSGVLNGKAIEKPQPSYPAEARAAHISGTVVVKIKVDETGKVIEAKPLCGPQALAQASVDAARKARFTPTLLSGQPVKVSGLITYTFVLR